MNRATRILKAQKIVALIGIDRFKRARRILEIGCGSGVIASTLGALGSNELEVHAVDVVDSRIETAGYAFKLVDGTRLPYDTDYFDLVVSNHVIEHVGTESEQLLHLREINRVLAPQGAVYLAVPNKWRLVEPHFRLPLLSWLPRAASDAYVRATGKGSHYDCEPLAYRHALALFSSAAFDAEDRTIDALRATLSIEKPTSHIAHWFNCMAPDWVPKLGMPIMPTYVFLLKAR